MSQTTDGKRRRAARREFARKMELWNAAMRKARESFWSHQAMQWPNGSRFANGTDKAKHLRGYWDEVERIAREVYGAKKPRPLPRERGLTTGGLRTGQLNTGHL